MLVAEISAIVLLAFVSTHPNGVLKFSLNNWKDPYNLDKGKETRLQGLRWEMEIFSIKVPLQWFSLNVDILLCKDDKSIN